MLAACDDTPGKADDLNFNHMQFVTWLEAKLGPVNGALTLPAGSVGTAQLVNGAVVGSKVADGAVDARVLAPGSVSTPLIGPGGRSVYAINALCADSNNATFATTCTYGRTVTCGSVCLGLPQPVYTNCDGSCPAPTLASSCIVKTCTVANTLRGSTLPN